MVCVLALQVKRIRRLKPSQHKLAPSIFFFFFKRRRGGRRRRKQGGSTNLALDRRKPNEQDNRRGKNHRAHNPNALHLVPELEFSFIFLGYKRILEKY